MKISILLISMSLSVVQVGLCQSNAGKRAIVKDYDFEKLDSLKKLYEKRFTENYALALSLSQQNGWKKSGVNKNGDFFELVGVTENGEPIYYTTLNRSSAATSRTNTLYPSGSLGLELTGMGMTVGIWDRRIPLASHNLFQGRVTLRDNGGSNFHATHVLGTMIGGAGVRTSAQGMASEASGNAYDWQSDLSEVAEEASLGLLISNHSYGYVLQAFSPTIRGRYDNNAGSFDRIMYNAPYYLSVFAAGNDRDEGLSSTGYDLLSGMACSKNGMTVAAVSRVSKYDGPSSVSMSIFSSWGPTDDGRIKPDISAQGVNVISASNGSNTDYAVLNGTSMAAPCVSGTLLLLQQHFFNVNNKYMLSSTLRGLACHTADEAGDDDGPDYEYGWGLINAEKAASVISRNGKGTVVSEITLGDGETYSLKVRASGVEKLMASITWTDPNGIPLSNSVNIRTPVLVNDLDLRIEQESNVFYPWKLDPRRPSQSATKADNLVDNIEKVEVSEASGIYKITVSHKGMLSQEQTFSLVVTGLADCNNEPDGTAYIDSCGFCVEGSTNLLPCVKDCINEFGGEAFIDSCGSCAGGSSGRLPVLNSNICPSSVEPVKIFPNPTTDIVNLIFFEDVPDNYSLTIHSLDGKLVREIRNITKNQLFISLANEAAGIYVLNLKSESINFVEKIILNN